MPPDAAAAAQAWSVLLSFVIVSIISGMPTDSNYKATKGRALCG